MISPAGKLVSSNNLTFIHNLARRLALVHAPCAAALSDQPFVAEALTGPLPSRLRTTEYRRRLFEKLDFLDERFCDTSTFGVGSVYCDTESAYVWRLSLTKNPSEGIGDWKVRR